jgi:hypothetical protein
MSTPHPVDHQLQQIGIDPSELDPDVLDALRDAHRGTTDPLQRAAETAVLTPPTASERAAAQRAFSADIAQHLGSGTDTTQPTDLQESTA